MATVGQRDLLVLYLDSVDRGEGEWADDRARTVAGVTEVLGGDGMAGTVELLSVIDELKGAGVIEPTDGGSVDRQQYRLTEHGRERATELRSALAERTITVRNGTTEEVQLSAVDQFLSPPAVPRALDQLTDDDVLYLDSPGERFVDRETELGVLESALQAVCGGDYRSVLVSGEPGIGKTTLVQERFGEAVDGSDARMVVAGSRTESTVPYAVFEDVFDTLPETDSPFGSTVTDLQDVAPEEYAARQEAMFEAAVEGLVSAAEDRPLVVVIEDLALADGPSLSLFEHVAGAATPGVLLVGTYRPANVTGDDQLSAVLSLWDRSDDERLEALSLSPFDREETKRQLQWLTGRPDVPPPFVDLVYERTGGNPLFVEEVTARTMESGTASPDRGVFPEDPSELVWPDSVEGAIERRLGALSDAHVDVLEMAALIGGSVPEAVLFEALEGHRSELRPLVGHLTDVGVFDRVDGGDLRFRSGIVRDALLDDLPADRTAALHGEIADAYETVLGDDPDQYASVAYHRRRAGAHEAAVEAYRRAGERALETFAAGFALDAYETAYSIVQSSLEWPEDDGRVLSILEGIADANRLLDDYESADQYLRYIAERVEDRQRRFSVAKDRAMLWRDRGHLSKALSIVEAERADTPEADTREFAELLRVQGTIHSHRQEYEAAERLFQRAHEIAESIGADELSRLTRNREAFIDMDRGTVDEGTLATWEDIVDEARTLDDPKYLADMLSNLGEARVHFGDIEGAREALLESVDIYDEIGTEMQACNTRNTLAVALTTAGAWEEAIDLYETSLATAESVGNEQVVAYTHNNLGSIYRFVGDLDASAEHLRTAMEYSEVIDNPILWGEQALNLSRIHLYWARFDDAEEIATDALETGVDNDSPGIRANAHGRIGHVLRHRGEIDRAIQQYRNGIELVENNDGLGAKNAAVPYLGLARAKLERDAHDRALEAATTAMEIAEGAMLDEVRINARLVLGACHREAGSLDEAHDHLDTAENVASDGGWAVMTILACYEQGLLAREAGRTADATTYFQEARSKASSIGAQLFVDMAADRLEDAPSQ